MALLGIFVYFLFAFFFLNPKRVRFTEIADFSPSIRTIDHIRSVALYRYVVWKHMFYLP